MQSQHIAGKSNIKKEKSGTGRRGRWGKWVRVSEARKMGRCSWEKVRPLVIICNAAGLILQLCVIHDCITVLYLWRLICHDWSTRGSCYWCFIFDSHELGNFLIQLLAKRQIRFFKMSNYSSNAKINTHNISTFLSSVMLLIILLPQHMYVLIIFLICLFFFCLFQLAFLIFLGPLSSLLHTNRGALSLKPVTTVYQPPSPSLWHHYYYHLPSACNSKSTTGGSNKTTTPNTH